MTKSELIAAIEEAVMVYRKTIIEMTLTDDGDPTADATLELIAALEAGLKQLRNLPKPPQTNDQERSH